MTALLQGLTHWGDLALAPVSGRPLFALALAALLFGALAVLLFKLATPQRRLGAARSRLIGRLFEAAIYQASLPVILAVQGRLVLANLRYLVLALPGLAALLAPLVLTLPQLEIRFGRRPLALGETALVSVLLKPGSLDPTAWPSLDPAEGLAVEAGPVRRPGAAELVWRVRAVAPGVHDLRLTASGEDVRLTVPVAVAGLPAVTRTRQGDIWRQIVHDPAARPLPARAQLQRVTVEMPGRELRVLGVRLPWLVVFTVIALAAGLVLRRPLRVEL